MTQPGGQEPLEKERKLQSAPWKSSHKPVHDLQAHRCPAEPVFRPSGHQLPVLPSREQAAGWRCCSHGMGVGGCWGRTKQTETWSARLESRPVGAAAAGCVGRAGLGMGWEAQFWVIAPEILPSGCRREGRVLPPNLSRLEWQGLAAPQTPPPPLQGPGCPGLSEVHGGAFRALAQFSLGGQASPQPTCRNHPPGLVREATGVVGWVPRGSSSVSGERATQHPCRHAQPCWPHELLCEQALGRVTQGEV